MPDLRSDTIKCKALNARSINCEAIVCRGVDLRAAIAGSDSGQDMKVPSNGESKTLQTRIESVVEEMVTSLETRLREDQNKVMSLVDKTVGKIEKQWSENMIRMRSEMRERQEALSKAIETRMNNTSRDESEIDACLSGMKGSLSAFVERVKSVEIAIKNINKTMGNLVRDQTSLMKMELSNATSTLLEKNKVTAKKGRNTINVFTSANKHLSVPLEVIEEEENIAMDEQRPGEQISVTVKANVSETDPNLKTTTTTTRRTTRSKRKRTNKTAKEKKPMETEDEPTINVVITPPESNSTST